MKNHPPRIQIDATRVKLVTWDVDGTLYDLKSMQRCFRRDALKALMSGDFAATLRELKYLRAFQNIMGQTRRLGCAIPTEQLPISLKEYEELHKRWFTPPIARVGPKPGILRLLDFIASRGVRQAVISDYIAEFKLKALKIESYFEKVYAGERIGYLKPAPRVFETASEDLGVSLSEVLHIGDRADTDGGAARLGAQVAILGDHYRTPDELASCLEGIGHPPQTASP